MVDANRPVSEELKSSSDGGNTPLSDTPLPHLLEALVNDRRSVVAAEAHEMTCRTTAACYESRRASRRMRRDTEAYSDRDVDNEQGDDAGGMAEVVASLEQRVAALEEQNRALREAVEAQAKQSRLVVH